MQSQRYEITLKDRNGKDVVVDAIMSNFEGTVEQARAHYEKEHPSETVVNFVEKGQVDRETIKNVAEAVNAGKTPANPFDNK